MTTVVLDLETIPSQLPGIRDELTGDIRPPGTMKKPESIAEWERESKPAAIEEAWLRTALDGGLGQVVVIGYAIDDEPVQAIVVRDLSPQAERDALVEFWQRMSKLHNSAGQVPVVVGHNVLGFDIPFLRRRSIVHRARPAFWWPRSPKPWSDGVYDTMLQWAADRDRISLHRLSRILGMGGKEGMTGADVWPAIQDGRIDDVAEYCRRDVEMTRDVWRRMTFAAEASSPIGVSA